ncbi:MAG: DNA internalization-related competence protein ComEC/Rec2 [Mariprofundaceae bacterium]|nr:DNA internalization-related competence protein ComEC/Rec2 [Mariprofundaceae bacterium]
MLPLLLPTLAWVTGCVIAQVAWISFTAEAWLVLAVLLLLLFCPYPQRHVLWWLLAAMFWATATLLYDAALMRIDTQWLESPQTLTATIVQQRVNAGLRRIRVDHVVIHQSGNDVAMHARIDLYQWGRSKKHWQQGDRIRLTARLRQPKNHANPGEFDYINYCRERHIALIGGVRGNIVAVEPNHNPLNTLRQRIRNNLPSEAAQTGVLQALLLGDRAHIPMAVNDAFAASGAAHLLAISGLHIGMVAGWAAIFVWWCCTRREAWVIAVSVRRMALLGGVLSAMAYATLAGWPLPTQRAVFMLLAAMCAWWWRLRYPPINVLCLALLCLLLWNPTAVLSISLWLSFAATAALLLLVLRQPSQTKGVTVTRLFYYFGTLLWVSFVASLATLPLIVDAFGRLPVWSMLANLLLVPLYGLWVLPAALLGVITTMIGGDTLAQFLFSFAGVGVAWGNDFLQMLLVAPAGNMWVATVPLWVSFVYVIGMTVAVLLFTRNRTTWSASMVVITLTLYLLLIIPERTPAAMQWVNWDVGQGAASTIMQVDGSILHVDAPGRRGSRFNGGTTVAAGLRQMGIVHIDILCISHAQSDHAGGVLRLLASMRRVERLCLADVPANRNWPPMKAAIAQIKARGGSVLWLQRGDYFNLGTLHVDILWPPAAYDPSNTNNTSLVLSIILPDGQRMLMGGDMEGTVERSLLQAGISPHAWMLMPHHGSRTSSHVSLLSALQPKVVVAQTGLHNQWHFPLEDIVERYLKIGAHVDNTAHGAVLYRWHDDGVSHEQWQPPKHTKYDTALQWVTSFL